MKFLLILVVVSLSVDGREVPDQLQEPASPILLQEDKTPWVIPEVQETYLQESEEEIISDDRNSAQERNVCNKPTISCSLAGGSCIGSGGDCGGTKDPKGCKGRGCACCIPPKEECNGCPEGYFYYPASDQCFKYFGNRSHQLTKHAEAEKTCADEGGRLAHPYDPIGLRDYIVTRYGSPQRNYAWLGARLPANTTTVLWDDNGAVLDNDNPMWYSYPQELTFTRCLLLLVNSLNWTLKPDQPFTLIDCKDGRPFICEFVRE